MILKTKYDPSISTKFVGVTGKTHKSVAEAKASFRLYPHGWVPCEAAFPQEFIDSEGTRYTALPDFHHPATGFYAEFKAHKMNGKGTRRAAVAAMTKIDSHIAQGLIAAAKRPYKALENAWNHSIQTMACKCSQLPSETPIVLIYETMADLNEERRCARNGVFMLSLDNLQSFNGFLLFASLGLNVEFSRNDFRYGVTPNES
ncbi:hypothetical protein PO883_28760 [Massilia sp. DJPM01]|uniref:hypothetical protein n=1 Tax=Massilia sp. DJPM01 TaxID=3024404 RepID=UPI00259F9B3A|nr:hypothetical protein [Massilia sp. DJPM01]MDM5181178.1 hypothetical protein [Massilia sp. DJPM01]